MYLGKRQYSSKGGHELLESLPEASPYDLVLLNYIVENILKSIKMFSILISSQAWQLRALVACLEDQV